MWRNGNPTALVLLDQGVEIDPLVLPEEAGDDRGWDQKELGVVLGALKKGELEVRCDTQGLGQLNAVIRTDFNERDAILNVHKNIPP